MNATSTVIERIIVPGEAAEPIVTTRTVRTASGSPAIAIGIMDRGASAAEIRMIAGNPIPIGNTAITGADLEEAAAILADTADARGPVRTDTTTITIAR
ncbi:MAG: hypothetical protein VX512_02465 [Pseudomonadota bacterium]|nr:hypothetical protein [Pseudomonadota bacterium]